MRAETPRTVPTLTLSLIHISSTPSPAPTASATPLAERPYGAFARVAYMDGFAQLTLQAGPALDAAPVAPLADGDYVETVSYTHLDVYKRQDPGI